MQTIISDKIQNKRFGFLRISIPKNVKELVLSILVL